MMWSSMSKYGSPALLPSAPLLVEQENRATRSLTSLPSASVMKNSMPSQASEMPLLSSSASGSPGISRYQPSSPNPSASWNSSVPFVPMAVVYSTVDNPLNVSSTEAPAMAPTTKPTRPKPTKTAAMIIGTFGPLPPC